MQQRPWGGGHEWEFVAHFPAIGGRKSCFKLSLYVQNIMGCSIYVYVTGFPWVSALSRLWQFTVPCVVIPHVCLSHTRGYPMCSGSAAVGGEQESPVH